jgi:DNA-directed RNA polymerase specialized sigma24 family protein
VASVSFEQALPLARNLAQRKAVRAIGRCGLTRDDHEDVASQLVATFYARFDRFDGNRASIQTFASRLMDRELNSILRQRLAICRRRTEEEDPLPDSGDVADAASGATPNAAERCHFWIDVERAMAPLPAALRQTALALCSHTPSELSRLPGQTHTVIYRRIRRLRRELLAAGIGPEYFASTGGVR